MPPKLPANPTGGADCKDVNVNRCCLVLKVQLNIYNYAGCVYVFM